MFLLQIPFVSEMYSDFLFINFEFINLIKIIKGHILIIFKLLKKGQYYRCFTRAILVIKINILLIDFFYKLLFEKCS